MPVCPRPRHGGTATVPPSALGSNYIFQFLLLTFHLPVLGGIGEGCPLRGSPGPHTGHPPMHSTSKGLPSARPLHSLPMLCSALLPLSPTPRPTSSLGQGLMGSGAKLGAQEMAEGKGKEMLSYLTSVPAGEGSRAKGSGAWRVLFYLLFPDFFVSKLADLYYTRTANKGRV